MTNYQTNRESFELFWKGQEQRLRDIGKFEGPKGVAYEVWRQMLEMAKPAVRIEKDPYGFWWIKFAMMAEGKFESAEAATAEALKRGARIVYTGPELPE